MSSRQIIDFYFLCALFASCRCVCVCVCVAWLKFEAEQTAWAAAQAAWTDSQLDTQPSVRQSEVVRLARMLVPATTV